MKYVRITGTPDPSVAPRLFRTLADSPLVDEARLVEWNLSSPERATLLFAADADAEELRPEIADTETATAVEVSAMDEQLCYLLLTLKPSVTPILREALGSVTRPGLVVVKPVVYRDGQVHARFVGDAERLQAALDSFPAAVDVTVHAIGEFHATRAVPSGTLSERQREAVEVALDLGYYDHPRNVTHEAVAERLGCSASTASEHLQKAESKLIERAMAR